MRRHKSEELVGKWNRNNGKYFGEFSNLIIRCGYLQILLTLPRKTDAQANPSCRHSYSQAVDVLRPFKDAHVIEVPKAACGLGKASNTEGSSCILAI